TPGCASGRSTLPRGETDRQTQASAAKESADDLRRVLPHDEADAHQALARDPARGDGERELLRQSRMARLQPPADEGADEEEQTVVPVEGPRQPDARGRRDPALLLRKQ